jgi:hypothetical protein
MHTNNYLVQKLACPQLLNRTPIILKAKNVNFGWTHHEQAIKFPIALTVTETSR